MKDSNMVGWMRVAASSVPVLWMAFGISARSASAAPIVEQRWDELTSGIQFPRNQESHSIGFAPFESDLDDNRVEQIVWWGTSSSRNFTLRFYDSILYEAGGFYRPENSPVGERNVTAKSIQNGAATDLIWINLSEGLKYLSIVGPDFNWYAAHDSDGFGPPTLNTRLVGSTEILVGYHADLAFVLNNTAEPVPEPSTALLLSPGLTILAAQRKTWVQALKWANS